MANKKESAQVKSVVLDSHYAFYDDDGVLLQWQEGHVVTDSEHVALLVERKAPITVKE